MVLRKSANKVLMLSPLALLVSLLYWHFYCQSSTEIFTLRPRGAGLSAAPPYLKRLDERYFNLRHCEMQSLQSRFVALIDDNGRAVCAPILVEFSEFSYRVSDAEFESRAIRI